MNKKARIKLIRSLSSPNTIRILDMLYQGSSCACEMVDELEMKHNLLSHHLSKLEDNSLVKSTRNGRHISYEIVDSKRRCIRKILDLVNDQKCN